MTIVLLAPVVSYYLAFINVILYNYDRFVIPVCLILAIFGGLCLDALLRSMPRAPRWSAALIAAVFAYSLLYSATVDAMMLRDSRRVAERWMKAHMTKGELVGVSGPSELLPRLDCGCADIGTLTQLRGSRPPYYVLSADYARAVPLHYRVGRAHRRTSTGNSGLSPDYDVSRLVTLAVVARRASRSRRSPPGTAQRRPGHRSFRHRQDGRLQHPARCRSNHPGLRAGRPLNLVPAS